MQPYKCISVTEAEALCASKPCQLVDIRDQASYQQGHIENAEHVGNHNLQDYLEKAERTTPVVIYCYHGHSSQSAAAFFHEQGFAEVYSVDGGYAQWSMLR